MKVIIAKETAEKPKASDFNWTTPGELLTFPSIVCEGPKEHRDNCGCGRAFTGTDSAKATTFAVVAEMPEAEVFERLAECSQAKDWGDLDPDLANVIRSEAVALYEMAADLPEGTEVRIENTPTTSALSALLPA